MKRFKGCTALLHHVVRISREEPFFFSQFKNRTANGWAGGQPNLRPPSLKCFTASLGKTVPAVLPVLTSGGLLWSYSTLSLQYIFLCGMTYLQPHVTDELMSYRLWSCPSFTVTPADLFVYSGPSGDFVLYEHHWDVWRMRWERSDSVFQLCCYFEWRKYSFIKSYYKSGCMFGWIIIEWIFWLPFNSTDAVTQNSPLA